VFFILDKGEVKSDLVQLRRDILDTHLPEGTYRMVEARDPERDRTAESAGYSPAVGNWRSARADIYERLIAEELGEDESGAFLIYWGAYLGTPDEILASGPLAETGPRIVELRAQARERKGWIMDTYLLRRHPRDEGVPEPD